VDEGEVEVNVFIRLVDGSEEESRMVLEKIDGMWKITSAD
jgi:hypothetical protein